MQGWTVNIAAFRNYFVHVSFVYLLESTDLINCLKYSYPIQAFINVQ